MGFIDMFPKSDKYGRNSGYLNERQRAMRERVRRICQEQGIEESCIEKERSLQEKIDEHKIKRISSNNKFKYGLVVVFALILVAFLIYLFSILF